MLHENINGLCARQAAYILPVNPPVAGQIQPQTPQGVYGHAKIRCATGIIGIINKTALAADNGFCDLLNC
jgi:hypothetical protein